jgi:hypothetical protein
MFLWMPDSPTEAKFLSDKDKILAIERLRDNQMGVMSREWRWPHFMEAVRDPKTWLWTVMIFCTSVPSNGIGVFGPLIIKSFVSDPYQTILFNVPVGVAHFTAVVSSAYVSMRWKVKGPVIALLCVPPIIGLSILLSYEHSAENKAVLLAGFFCICTFTGISMSSHIHAHSFTVTNSGSSSHLLLVLAEHGRRHKTQIIVGSRLHWSLCRQHHWSAPLHA